MPLAAILFLGILTMWVPGRWTLSAFQVAIFVLAGFQVIRKPVRFHPVGCLLGLAAVWGVIQIVVGWTVDPHVTLDAVLNWLTNLAAFALALELSKKPERHDRFLEAVLWFGFLVSIISTVTVLASPPGKIVGWFDAGTDRPTLGPFVYHSQYAAFIEAILPMALLRAMLDRRRWVLYVAMVAVMFASVVAGASRAGTILCLAEIVTVPLIAWVRGIVSARILARVMLAGAVAVGLLTAAAGWDLVWSRLQQPDPYAQRRELLRSSLAMLHDRPLTGFGLGAWSAAYPGYALYDDGLFVNQAHNDWAQWAAEGGIPFLLVMMAIVGVSVQPAVRSIWGLGILFVFLHCFVDYPMQQRPTLAAFFFAMLGIILGNDGGSGARQHSGVT